MVKLCVICGIVDNIDGVTMHGFPTINVRRIQWMEFVGNRGFAVTHTSKLCSRHFIPGVDYAVGNAQRRRLMHTAVPSLMGTQVNGDSEGQLRLSKRPRSSNQSAGSSPLVGVNSDDEYEEDGSHLIEKMPLESAASGSPLADDDLDDEDEYMKITKYGHITDVLKATPAPPHDAMPSRKRLQPQTKKIKRQKVYPKSPLKVFDELFKDVPIELQEHSINAVLVYTATFVIEGQLYTANHTSKILAKQMVCEHFFNSMLARQLIELYEKKESPMETVVEDGENGNVPKRPSQEDFPWPQFASLAMNKLLYPCQSDVIKSRQNLIAGIRVKLLGKFPDNPKKYHPKTLLYGMKPGVEFIDTIIHPKTPIVFQTKCEIDGNLFIGQGRTKKAAKKECCIAAIKCLWNFDYHAT